LFVELKVTVLLFIKGQDLIMGMLHNFGKDLHICHIFTGVASVQTSWIFFWI